MSETEGYSVTNIGSAVLVIAFIAVTVVVGHTQHGLKPPELAVAVALLTFPLWAGAILLKIIEVKA